nr:Ig-like domain repeat protein [Tahibacter caeni]
MSAVVWGSATADQSGQHLSASPATRENTSSIQERQSTSTHTARVVRVLDHPDKSATPQNPDAPAVAQYPADVVRTSQSPNIHTTAVAFDGAALADTGSFPPDSMGAIGPAQFVTFVNGRIRSFTKNGVADGVLDADPDVFFASVMTPVGGTVVSNFTLGPQVRYDRFSARWFLTITDVPCTDATCTTTAPNRVLIAVSDAASSGTLSGSTVWTFFQFQADPGTNFCENPSLGVDVNALYIGCNLFTNTGTFVGTNGYVVRKTSVLGAGPATVTMFANLVAGGSGAGPFSPRGVDNYDATATDGYFVGVDNATFSTIMFRRVSNPGSATPAISANISVTVPTTTFPNPVTHAGNTGGNNGRLDSLDDRLYAAMIRNGRLWSAHNFRVSSAGVANTAAAARNAVRWYEFQNLATTPTLVQSGTVFDNAATLAAARQYWMPSVIVTGQGHSVMGMSMSGTPVGATPVYVGRLAGDTLGTMTGPPTVAAVTFGTTTANYNPPADPGGATGRRWGSYSFTSLDPLDDMTVWTIQEYNQALNSYAVRVGRLAAPPPATPTCSGSPVTFGGPTGNVVINATSSAGSGFYDPGANLPAPALPFTHLNATVTNATVNSVTYNSPTQVTLNITALATGLQNVTVTNPDGQSVTANGCINVQNALAADLAITKTDGVTTATPGGSVTYTVTASNPSAVAATGATVADTFPAALTCTWTCVGAGGGTCTASGSGNISDTVNLPAGGSATYTATCAISAAATGTLSNTATVTIAGDPNAANNSATDTDTLIPQADLGITKTDGVTSATPGGSVTYTITASNAGPSNATGTTIADTFPASLTCTWTCVGAGGGTCTASGSGNIADTVNLPAGGSTTYTASCTIAASASGTLSNTATVAAPGGVTDPTPGNNAATDTDTLAAQADLAITKTDGVTSATPGGSVTYTITASNAGPSNATGATVADTFPATQTCTWTCVGAGGGTCTASGSGNIADTVNLPAGGSTTYTASCTIAASASGTLSNTATVAAPGGVTDPTPGNNAATDTDTLAAQADLAITKTDGVTSATPGGSVTYTITASNAGPSNATGATVADTFPASQTCTWTCVGAGGGTCTASGSSNISDTVNLPAGGSTTYTASCAISASATGSMSNTAIVTAPGGVTDPTPGNNTATDTDTLTALADLTIAKSHAGNFTQGQTGAIYTLTISNVGGSPTSGMVTATDTLPAGLTATAIGGGGWTCTLATLTCTRPDALAAGSGYPPITLTVNVASNATASVTNTAAVSGGGQTNTNNDTAADPTTITQLSDLTITKTHVGNFSQGQTGAIYTLTPSNAGAGPTSGTVMVTDTLPAGLTATAISGTGWSCTVATVTCTRSDALAAGSSYPAITLTVNVANNAPASVTNTAAVSGGGQINTSNDSASDATTIATAAFTIGGTVGGATSPATLTLNDSTNGTSQSLSSNGAFTFTTPLPIGADWNVVVTTPPAGQSCAVANGAGTNLSANVTNVQVTCAAVLVTIAPAALTAGTFGLPYSQQLSASSSDAVDHAPYTFTLASGSLPPGLNLGTNGLLSGTPTAAGSFPFAVQAAGSGGVSGQQAYTLVVNRQTTTVTVTAAPNPTSQGVPVNLVATVASGTPTGTVIFSADGAALPCSPVTVVVGTTSSTATCTTAFTTPGAHAITASYSGDANYEPSTSPVVTVAVDVPAVPVPALDRWAMLLLVGLLALMTLARLRRI